MVIQTHFASRDSLFLWALTSHRARRQRYRAAMAADEFPDLRIVRLASGADAEAWLSRQTVRDD